VAKEDIVKYQFNNLPAEKQQEIQRKGTEASTRVRKEKASFKQAIKWLAENGDLKITQGDLYDLYIKNGIDISKLDTTKLATIGLWFGAATGKAENYKVLMEGNNEIAESKDTVTPDVEIKVIENKDLEKIMYEDND
jgi:hypothetical protein